MNLWNENRLIDVMSYLDPELLEEDFPECDLENEAVQKVSEEKQHRRHVALVAGVTAGSLALTGVALLVCRKHDWLRHMQRMARKSAHVA